MKNKQRHIIRIILFLCVGLVAPITQIFAMNWRASSSTIRREMKQREDARRAARQAASQAQVTIPTQIVAPLAPAAAMPNQPIFATPIPSQQPFTPTFGTPRTPQELAAAGVFPPSLVAPQLPTIQPGLEAGTPEEANTQGWGWQRPALITAGLAALGLGGYAAHQWYTGRNAPVAPGATAEVLGAENAPAPQLPGEERPVAPEAPAAIPAAPPMPAGFLYPSPADEELARKLLSMYPQRDLQPYLENLAQNNKEQLNREGLILQRIIDQRVANPHLTLEKLDEIRQLFHIYQEYVNLSDQEKFNPNQPSTNREHLEALADWIERQRAVLEPQRQAEDEARRRAFLENFVDYETFNESPEQAEEKAQEFLNMDREALREHLWSLVANDPNQLLADGLDVQKALMTRLSNPELSLQQLQENRKLLDIYINIVQTSGQTMFDIQGNATNEQIIERARDILAAQAQALAPQEQEETKEEQTPASQEQLPVRRGPAVSSRIAELQRSLNIPLASPATLTAQTEQPMGRVYQGFSAPLAGTPISSPAITTGGTPPPPPPMPTPEQLQEIRRRSSAQLGRTAEEITPPTVSRAVPQPSGLQQMINEQMRGALRARRIALGEETESEPSTPRSTSSASTGYYTPSEGEDEIE